MHLKELDANLIVVLDALLIDASVTKAALRLGRSPSAVSHALANLRYIFNDELFVRAGQRLAPTARAKELAPTIHIIVSGLESLLRTKEPFNPGTQERNFTIVCPEMAELYFLPILRALINEEAGNIHIERIGTDTKNNFEDLRQGKSDFVLVEGELTTDVADINWIKVKEESYITLANKDFKWAGKKITQKAFQNQSHIITQSSNTKPGTLEYVLLNKSLAEEKLFKAASPIAGILMAMELGAIVTVPKLHANLISSHIPIKEVTLPFTIPKMEIHLGWHRSFERDECHQWLRKHAQNCFEVKNQKKIH